MPPHTVIEPRGAVMRIRQVDDAEMPDGHDWLVITPPCGDRFAVVRESAYVERRADIDRVLAFASSLPKPAITPVAGCACTRQRVAVA